jgi:hypothetical protein
MGTDERHGEKPPPPERPRQAVVIIHGIGEQRPMDTLRSFVSGVVGDKRLAHSKPDRISPTLELRRLSVPAGSDPWRPGQPVSTDFYELYWAHLMSGTSWNHVIAWVGVLMLRLPDHVPPRLLPLWVLSWLAAAAATVAVCGSWRPDLSAWPLIAIALAGAAVVARATGRYFGLQYVGDAARYLSPTPPNIGVRHAIRSAALDLLRGLHDDPTWHRYHRIIVVGHSLGSVIGYDALTHLWQERHHPTKSALRSAPQPDHEQLAGASSLADGRALQSSLWREQRAIGVDWKITDFVTLGSPLAHAAFLLAKDGDDFDSKKRQREFPSCPPQPEDPRDRDYGQSLLRATAVGAKRASKLLHHAAPFACTRWTNLYFSRDLVGGSLKPLFGDWIDEPEQPGVGSRRFFPHTHYWDASERTCDALRNALELDAWWTRENADAVLSRGVGLP